VTLKNSVAAAALAFALVAVGGTATAAWAADGDVTPTVSETATVSIAEPTELPAPISTAPTGTVPAAPLPAPSGTVTVTGGTLSDGSTSGTFAPGTTVSVEANFPDPGMAFTGWTATGVSLDDPSAPWLSFEMPDGDVRLVATYARAFSLAVGLGTINGTEMFGQYAPGEVLDLAAFDAPAGQVFARWNVVPESLADNLADPTSPTTTFQMPRSSVLIRASYTVGHELTMAASPSQGGALVGAGQYAADRTVDIAAIPADGYAFTGWTVGDGTNPVADAAAVETTLQMPSGPLHVVANFAPVAGGVTPGDSNGTAVPATRAASAILDESLTSALRDGRYVWSTDGQPASPIAKVLVSVTFQFGQ